MALSQKRSFVNGVLLNISLFRIIYMTALFFASFYYVCVPAVILKYALMPWGLTLIYFYYIRSERIKNVFYARWLICFCGAAFVTALIHVVDNFLPNMVMLGHIIICFFIFYGMHTERNKKRIKKEIYDISLFITIACVVTSLAGIVLIFATGAIRVDSLDYDIVIYKNRFTGLLTNPNLLGYYSVFAIFCTHMLSKKDFIKESGKPKLPVWFFVLSYAVNLLALFLCDSNASLILLILYIFGNLVYEIFGYLRVLSVKQIITKSFVLLACFLVLASSLFVVRWGANVGFTAVLSSKTAISFQTPQKVTEDIKEKPITFEHVNKNIDSGRIELLKEAAVLIGNYPLMGIGKENLTTFGDRYIDGGLHFSDLHNGYLTILVCSGIVGLVLFIGFAIHLARHCTKSLFLEEKNLKHSIFPCLFSFVFAYCIYAVSEKALLYEQTFMVVTFWLVIGYLSCYMVKFNHINEKFEVARLFKRKSDHVLDDADIPTDDIV